MKRQTNIKAVLGGAAFCLAAQGALAEGLCAPDSVAVFAPEGESRARFTVEIADDAEERARGLMHRDSLAASQGMLFVYERPGAVSFWMENTLIPLDMIFVDQHGVVTRVHENAVPLDRTPIPGGAAVFAVLEINGGLSRALGIGEGDILRHPAFGGDAVMPCQVQ